MPLIERVSITESGRRALEDDLCARLTEHLFAPFDPAASVAALDALTYED